MAIISHRNLVLNASFQDMTKSKSDWTTRAAVLVFIAVARWQY